MATRITWRRLALLLLTLFAGVARAGDPTVVHTFTLDEGTATRLIVGPDGALYGALSGGEIFRYTASGAYSVIATGINASGLATGLDGNLYATTVEGGSFGKGSVVRITLGGVKTTIASFDGTTAGGPRSIVRGQDGNFYGTSAIFSQQLGSSIVGIFKVTPAGVLTKLASFAANELLAGTDGNLYGTIGNAQCSCSNSGSVFRITPGGVVTTLHNLDGSDGWYPAAGLAQAPNGTLYGVTKGEVPLGLGGPAFNGEVFQLAPDGSNFAKVYQFTDWRGSSLRPLRAMDGTLFGALDPNLSDSPEVFRVHPQTGKYERLFYGNPIELTQPADGNIYALDPGSPPFFPADLLRLKRPTTVTSKGLFSVAPVAGQIKFNASATLTDDMSTHGVAGQTLRFIHNGQTLCTTVTDANGAATCKATVQENLQQATGYQVYYSGNSLYDASGAKGYLLCVGTVCE